MRFDQIGAFQRELLVEAWRHQEVQRLRALIGVPVSLAIAAADLWFFVLQDDTGNGGLIGWPVFLLMVGIAGWMTLETVTNRRLRWALRGLDLEGSEREILASMRSSPLLAAERARARSEIGAELKEGARRADQVRRRGVWGLGSDDE